MLAYGKIWQEYKRSFPFSMKNVIHYLSEAEVIAINEEMVSLFGGLHGVRDLNLLRSAIGRPQMSAGFQDAYKSIFGWE